jgi:hypothetical protein
MFIVETSHTHKYVNRFAAGDVGPCPYRFGLIKPVQREVASISNALLPSTK